MMDEFPFDTQEQVECMDVYGEVGDAMMMDTNSYQYGSAAW